MKHITINGVPFVVGLLSGGESEHVLNEWDSLVNSLGTKVGLLNSRRMYSWCNDVSESGSGSLRTIRGYTNPHYWNCAISEYKRNCYGFRPILTPLFSDTMEPNPYYLSKYKDGDIFKLGCLMLDGIVKLRPVHPDAEGDIPCYHGEVISFGDTPEDEAAVLQWIAWNNRLVCDRNILMGISWDELAGLNG